MHSGESPVPMRSYALIPLARAFFCTVHNLLYSLSYCFKLFPFPRAERVRHVAATSPVTYMLSVYVTSACARVSRHASAKGCAEVFIKKYKTDTRGTHVILLFLNTRLWMLLGFIFILLFCCRRCCLWFSIVILFTVFHSSCISPCCLSRESLNAWSVNRVLFSRSALYS